MCLLVKISIIHVHLLYIILSVRNATREMSFLAANGDRQLKFLVNIPIICASTLHYFVSLSVGPAPKD